MSVINNPEFIADCIKWRRRRLYGRFAHWCYDWDDLPTDETCGEEFDCCHCFTEQEKAGAPGAVHDKETPMHARNIDHMFHGLTFTKPAIEIACAAQAKVKTLKAKVEERQRRINDLRAEYDIDDAALIQLLQAARKQDKALAHFAYSTSKMSGGKKELEERTVGAGVVNNLLTENDFIEAERDQIKTLERIARNLKPIPRFASGNGAELPPEEFKLLHEELEYLGF